MLIDICSLSSSSVSALKDDLEESLVLQSRQAGRHSPSDARRKVRRECLSSIGRQRVAAFEKALNQGPFFAGKVGR